jgi:tRNA(Ile)-lysidine synthase
MRLRLYAETVRKHGLGGVLLAHHADDQAETVLHRLLRGAGLTGLGGMAMESVQKVAGERLVLRRPLLEVRRNELREFLRQRGQSWREDSSNQSDRYMRNRLRRVLDGRDALSESLIELGRACRKWAAWVRENAPRLDDCFETGELRDLPAALAESAAHRYLLRQGSPAEDLTPAVMGRLIEMANDAASPARRAFPGGILIRRRHGMIGKWRVGQS